MRHHRPLVALLAAAAATLAPIGAPVLIGPAVAAAQGTPPHAWLFGSWTGGLFPAPANLPASACLQQPVVVFTREIVLRASITDQFYSQRLIETARTSAGATEFRFAPVAAASSNSGLLGLAGPQATVGFGCDDPNVLHVQRKSDNEITFPGCADFPNPLVRCKG